MRVRLRHERLQRELAKSRRSQSSWAEKLGLDSGHFSKLVNGRRRYPGASTRQKLLEGLGLELVLYEVDPLDPETFAAVAIAIGMAAVVMLASYLPARGAASVDPVVTLRHE